MNARSAEGPLTHPLLRLIFFLVLSVAQTLIAGLITLGALKGAIHWGSLGVIALPVATLWWLASRSRSVRRAALFGTLSILISPLLIYAAMRTPDPFEASIFSVPPAPADAPRPPLRAPAPTPAPPPSPEPAPPPSRPGPSGSRPKVTYFDRQPFRAGKCPGTLRVLRGRFTGAALGDYFYLGMGDATTQVDFGAAHRPDDPLFRTLGRWSDRKGAWVPAPGVEEARFELKWKLDEVRARCCEGGQREGAVCAPRLLSLRRIP